MTTSKYQLRSYQRQEHYYQFVIVPVCERQGRHHQKTYYEIYDFEGDFAGEVCQFYTPFAKKAPWEVRRHDEARYNPGDYKSKFDAAESLVMRQYADKFDAAGVRNENWGPARKRVMIGEKNWKPARD